MQGKAHAPRNCRMAPGLSQIKKGTKPSHYAKNGVLSRIQLCGPGSLRPDIATDFGRRLGAVRNILGNRSLAKLGGPVCANGR